MSTPPACTKRLVDLPLSRLSVMEAGDGPLLIMLPATISEVDDYTSLVQFMGQWFHVLFFELPGHGLSTPFPVRFSSVLVAEMVGQLVDSLGCERFNLMGFSFGGILAMRTFFHLSARIDRIVLNAPCLGHRTLALSARRKDFLRQVNHFLDTKWMHRFFFNLVHSPITMPMVVKFLATIGRLERTIQLQNRLPHVQLSTLEVLNAQINEILTTEFEVKPQKYTTPCFFNMSIYDPLLQFDITLEILQSHFENITTQRLTYPFHQPPQPFTLEELNRDFHATVDAFMR